MTPVVSEKSRGAVSGREIAGSNESLVTTKTKSRRERERRRKRARNGLYVGPLREFLRGNAGLRSLQLAARD